MMMSRRSAEKITATDEIPAVTTAATRAWKRLLAGFEEDEHEQMRQALVAKIEGERHGVTAAKEFPRETP